MPNPWRKRFKPYAKSYTSFTMVDNHDDFIGIVNEVFPPPAGWVVP